MIRTGIFYNKNSGEEASVLVRSFKDVSVVYPVKDCKNYSLSISEMKEELNSWDAVYFAGTQWNSEIVKMILREEVHLYCKTIPLISLEEAKFFYELEKEAGCIVQFFHPYFFLPSNFNRYKKLESQFFIDGRLKFDIKENLEQQILYFLLFVLSIENSLFSRSEVYSLENGKTFSFLDISLYFSSGNVIRLNLSPLIPFASDISVYQKNNSRLSFYFYDISGGKDKKAEKHSFGCFIKAIGGKSSLIISFAQIYQANLILEDIKGKLKFRGSGLLKSNSLKE